MNYVLPTHITHYSGYDINDDVTMTSQISFRIEKMPKKRFLPFFGVFLPQMTWAAYVDQNDFLLRHLSYLHTTFYLKTFLVKRCGHCFLEAKLSGKCKKCDIFTKMLIFLIVSGQVLQLWWCFDWQKWFIAQIITYFKLKCDVLE